MKNLFHRVGYAVFVVLVFVSCQSNRIDYSVDGLQILKINEQILDSSVKQLLLVFNEEANDHKAMLVAFEKSVEVWKPVYRPIPAGIGKNGFAERGRKLEGDGKSPSGIFKLRHLYSYEKVVDTKMLFTQSTDEDKWIDDPESDDYNTFVRGNTSAKTFEKLKLNSIHYKYCMVIEYNTNPLIKGKGSAIFSLNLFSS